MITHTNCRNVKVPGMHGYPADKVTQIQLQIHSVELLVSKPSIRMYILMLDTCNEGQTNDVHMYIEEYLF